jgi:acetyltransferase-like isoleucine patch superfamily enzyme
MLLLKKAVSAICFLLPSGLSRILFRLVGHRIGKNTRLPLFSYVYADRLELGNDVDIRPFVVIRVGRCIIGNNSIVSFGTQIVGDKGFLTKDNCFIGPQCVIHCEENVSFGFYSGLGARCIIYSHGSFLPVTKGYPVKFAEVVLEDYVWTGLAVLFLPGAHVESNCIINPGVVVSSRIPSGTLLQVDAKQFQRLELDKVVRFAKRDNDYYHRKILSSFFSSMKIDYSNAPGANWFQTSEGYRFESDPDANIICLHLPNKNQSVLYDLGEYYCDDSSDKLHKAFLSFLRLRFGITLRTDYSRQRLTRRQ